ncbi:MAG: hypothetical protein PV345_02395 [Wolbachia sp.]|nr:hypothetical protein [Wolbachia sp.]
MARKYPYKYRKGYDGNVMWINDENFETIKNSFLELAKDNIGIPLKINMEATIQQKPLLKKYTISLQGGKEKAYSFLITLRNMKTLVSFCHLSWTTSLIF